MRVTKGRFFQAQVKAAFGISAIIGGGGILLGDVPIAVIGALLTAFLRELDTLVDWDNMDESFRFHKR